MVKWAKMLQDTPNTPQPGVVLLVNEYNTTVELGSLHHLSPLEKERAYESAHLNYSFMEGQ